MATLNEVAAETVEAGAVMELIPAVRPSMPAVAAGILEAVILALAVDCALPVLRPSDLRAPHKSDVIFVQSPVI